MSRKNERAGALEDHNPATVREAARKAWQVREKDRYAVAREASMRRHPAGSGRRSLPSGVRMLTNTATMEYWEAFN